MSSIFARLWFLLLILFFCVNQTLFSCVQEVLSLDEVQTFLDTMDCNSLVVFDLDETLIRQKDAIQQHWFKRTSFAKQINAELDHYISSMEDPMRYKIMIASKG